MLTSACAFVPWNAKALTQDMRIVLLLSLDAAIAADIG